MSRKITRHPWQAQAVFDKLWPDFDANMTLRAPSTSDYIYNEWVNVMKILAVDDDPTVLDMLRDSLTKKLGFDLVCAETAEDALSLLQDNQNSFECFLLDIILPGVDGIELCSVIRGLQTYKSTPIIMITGSQKHDLMENAFRAGATDFIFKPLNGVELAARINTAGMLNDSMRREREACHSLAELTELMKIRRDESFDLNVVGVDDLHGFENRLLRLPEGCYAMNLFVVKLPQIRNIFGAVTPHEFCTQMVCVAEATVDALAQDRFFLGHAGSGMLVGVVMGRARFNPEATQRKIEAALDENTTVQNTQTDLAADIAVQSISGQRLWSGLSACNAIRDYLVANKVEDGSQDDASEDHEELLVGF